jgi:nucleotidyltransferase/DNA polymerase involved in DNA repair
MAVRRFLISLISDRVFCIPIIGAKVVSILGKVIKSAIIEKASIDEVYLDVTAEATRRLNLLDDDAQAFSDLILMATSSSLAGEDAAEMKMSKKTLCRGHSGTKKDEDGVAEGPNVRDWFDQPHYIWNHDDKLLLLGAIICDELRSEVFKQLGYSCSGGVAHNKMLSKIASAMHKPNRQTLVPSCAVKNMMACIPINRVAGFGGKLGESLADFGGRKLEKFSDLIEIGRSELSAAFGEESASWMLNAAAGIDHTPVEQRALTASIGCGKSYRQKNTLPPAALTDGRVLHWLRELSEELEERVQADTDMHSRKPKQITVGLSIAYEAPPKHPGEVTDVVKKWHDSQGMSLSKVGPMCVGATAISKAAHAMAVRAVADSTRLNKPWNITYISLSASGFVPVANESHAISSFFRAVSSPPKCAVVASPSKQVEDSKDACQMVSCVNDTASTAALPRTHLVELTTVSDSCDDSTAEVQSNTCMDPPDPDPAYAYLDPDSPSPVRADLDLFDGTRESSDRFCDDDPEGDSGCVPTDSIKEISSFYAPKDRKQGNHSARGTSSSSSICGSHGDLADSPDASSSRYSDGEDTRAQRNRVMKISDGVQCESSDHYNSRMDIISTEKLCSVQSSSISRVRAEEVDMDVFNALPPELQRELSLAFKIPIALTIPPGPRNMKVASLVSALKGKIKEGKMKAPIASGRNAPLLEKSSGKTSSLFGSGVAAAKDQGCLVAIDNDDDDDDVCIIENR